jgi:hypothetical protein
MRFASARLRFVWLIFLIGTVCGSLTVVQAQAPPCLDWSDHGFAPQNGPVMCYDPKRDAIVMYTRSAQPQLDFHTWEFAGGEWLRVATTGPRLRISTLMAFDEARGVAVLFGARNSIQERETWEWNGATWALRSTEGPVFAGGSMAYDADRGVCVVHGGAIGEGQIVSETWEWNGQTWVMAAATGPSPRVMAAACSLAGPHPTDSVW